MLVVAQSKVADGSMYNRNNLEDEAVVGNRLRFLEKHRVSLDQTTLLLFPFTGDDFCRYQLLRESDKAVGMRTKTPFEADAFIVTEPGHAVLLAVADCVGAVIHDPKHGVFMVSHLGRHSLEQSGGQKSIEYLISNFGSNPAELEVWLTAAPNKEAYPIWALDNQGMKDAALGQLQMAGVRIENIHDNLADTATDKNYYSYSEFLKGNREEDGDHCIVAMMVED